MIFKKKRKNTIFWAYRYRSVIPELRRRRQEDQCSRLRQVLEVHTHNPSYSEDRDQEDLSSEASPSK
jgi:hypothetical protein